MDDSAKRAQEAHLIAKLLGHTSAQMNQIDNNIVDDSPSLKKADDWNPEHLLKQHLGASTQVPVMEHPIPELAQVPLAPQVDSSMTPPPPPASTEHGDHLLHNMKSDYVHMLNVVMSKLESIEEKVDKLATLDEHIKNSVDRGLKGKMKQVTIKLNDTTST